MGLAAGFDAVGQGACQVGQGVDGGCSLAQHVAYGALPGVLAVDVGFKAGLVVGELALQGSGVEVSHPTFGLVDFCALLSCVQHGLSIQGYGVRQVHAFFKGVLLVAAVQGHPGVGGALAGGVARASARLVLDEGFNPGMFDAQGFGLRARDQGNVVDPALAPDLLGCVDGLRAAHPVEGLGGGDVYGTGDVPRGDVAGAQQSNEQAGSVHGVAGFLVQRVLRALYAALGGHVVDVVVHPLVDLVGVVAQGLGQGFDGVGMGGIHSGRQIGGAGGAGGFGGALQGSGFGGGCGLFCLGGIHLDGRLGAHALCLPGQLVQVDGQVGFAGGFCVHKLFEHLQGGSLAATACLHGLDALDQLLVFVQKDGFLGELAV